MCLATTFSSVTPAPGRRRLVALAWDYSLIVAWLAVLTVVGVSVRLLGSGFGAASPDTLPTLDLIAFAISVLPVGIYLAVTEAGTRQATWGKGRAGLRVVSPDGGRPAPWRIALRTAVKLLPWQLGHLAVARLIVGVDLSAMLWAAYALSLLIPPVSIAMAWRDPQARALHDRLAGTRVVVA